MAQPKGAGVKRHTHKYYKNEYDLWKCASCSHYLPTNLGEREILSRKSVCWTPGCNEVFDMDERSAKYDKPICQDCYANSVKKDNPFAEAGLDVDEVIAMIAERTRKLAQFRKDYPNITIPDDVDPEEYIRKMMEQAGPGRANESNEVENFIPEEEK